MTSPDLRPAGALAHVRPAVTCVSGFLVGARLGSSPVRVTDLVNAVVVLAAFLIGGWFLIRWPFLRQPRRSRYEHAPRMRRRAYPRLFRRNHRWRHRGW